MAWMIGIDEAGYGPNLGPLVVAATVWRVDEPVSRSQEPESKGSLATAKQAKIDLYERLSHIVSSAPREGFLAIADSKQLYKPRGTLRQLERGVLTALTLTTGNTPSYWSELITGHGNLPWYADFDCPLPIDASVDEIDELAERFKSQCNEVEVELTGVYTRLVFPREFNELVDHHGTKSSTLSHVSIGLLREAVGSLPTVHDQPPADIHITCDKHGARNRYAALLQHHFPEHWIDTLEESLSVSRYSWASENAQFHVAFRAKGENELPTALASMSAKYHRELAMKAFNTFWCDKVPGLKPTAGYPQDAKRFYQAIAAKRSNLPIQDADLWRNR